MEQQPICVRISEQDDLPAVDEFGPFRAVVILDAAYTDEWQDEVSRWLVDSGCLYMMAWGPGCSSWDDSVDHAMRQKYLPDQASEHQFVMTTWHDDETLEEVFWFCQFCAFDPYGLIEHTLIVHVGNADKEAELLGLFEKSYTLAEREEDEVS